MSLNELLQEKREDILRIATKRGASNVRVFGSVARGEADSKSDIDLLVDLEPGRSLFDLGGLPQPFVANVASDYDELSRTKIDALILKFYLAQVKDMCCR